MPIYTLDLTPKECAALLEAIVDCDPELYKNIENCAKQYTDNPAQYEQEEEMLKLFYNIIVPEHQCQICNIEHNEYFVIISWYHTEMDCNYQSTYNVMTKKFTQMTCLCSINDCKT